MMTAMQIVCVRTAHTLTRLVPNRSGQNVDFKSDNNSAKMYYDTSLVSLRHATGGVPEI
jgi:hypothetical protein